MNRISKAIMSVAGGLAAVAQAQTFDNAAIVKLHAAGLGDEALIAKVHASPCAFDLSTDQLIALTHAGISDRVLTAMVERCAGAGRAQGQGASSDANAAHRPGIYFSATGDRGLVMLRPTVASGLHVSGNGSILFPFKATLTIPQASAQLKVQERSPTFYFYFDPANQQVGDFGTVGTGAAQSPNEFSLVRFRDDHGGRQFQIGKVKGLGGNTGIDPRNTIAFTASESGDGAFRIALSAPLDPGEYGFVLPGENNRYRIYDFSVSASSS